MQGDRDTLERARDGAALLPLIALIDRDRDREPAVGDVYRQHRRQQHIKVSTFQQLQAVRASIDHRSANRLPQRSRHRSITYKLNPHGLTIYFSSLPRQESIHSPRQLARLARLGVNAYDLRRPSRGHGHRRRMHGFAVNARDCAAQARGRELGDGCLDTRESLSIEGEVLRPVHDDVLTIGLLVMLTALANKRS